MIASLWSVFNDDQLDHKEKKNMNRFIKLRRCVFHQYKFISLSEWYTHNCILKKKKRFHVSNTNYQTEFKKNDRRLFSFFLF